MSSNGTIAARRAFDGRSLDDRDVAYIKRWMPLTELASRLYFRVRVYGLDEVPAEDPVIFVGNHSGGLTTPDSIMTAHALWSRFGAERPTYGLIHPSIFQLKPFARSLVRMGGVAATPQMAHRVLRSGVSMLIYPGGGDEAYRSFANRNVVDLRGRSAYVRLAMRYGAPIVPVVALGGHETLVVLNDGEAIAKTLRLDRLGIPRIPIVYSWPFGITHGFHHSLPFPARIDIAFGKPIRLQGFTGGGTRSRDAAACHNHIERRMQAMLDALVEARAHERRDRSIGRG